MTTTNQGREREDAPETEAFRKFFKKVQPPQFMGHSSWLNGVAIGWQGAMAEARSTPPAGGAGEMREACAKACRDVRESARAPEDNSSKDFRNGFAVACRSIEKEIQALPAPTVEAGEGEDLREAAIQRLVQSHMTRPLEQSIGAWLSNAKDCARAVLAHSKAHDAGKGEEGGNDAR